MSIGEDDDLTGFEGNRRAPARSGETASGGDNVVGNEVIGAR
jgi:hypothetical protein